MNQILIAEKLYVTPAMRKKKKLFKIEFFLSVFALVILSTYGICSAYDRNKSEAVSKEILGAMEIKPEKMIVEEQAVVLVLNSTDSTVNIDDIERVTVSREIQVSEEQKVTARDGTVYYTIGQIYIPKINCKYPILASEVESDDDVFDTLLKIAPVKFHGANPNEIGNFCIVGHNYRNSQFFNVMDGVIHINLMAI